MKPLILTIFLLAAFTTAAHAVDTTNAAWLKALPTWINTPATDLSSEMSVTLTIPNNPDANTMIKISMMMDAKGKITRQGSRQYRAGADESGAIILWTAVASMKKPGENSEYFSYPWLCDWLKGKELEGTNTIQKFDNFALRTEDGKTIAFRGTKVLASCSNIFAYRDGGQLRRFVIVDYDYEFTGNEPMIETRKPTFMSRKRVTWPYDTVFLKKVVETKNEGDALYESADYLLKTIEKSAKKPEKKEQ